MLTVQGLAVEAGGTLVLADATFTVRARDKVGLVGRNGAGKTSVLGVLGGGHPPVAGTVRRDGGVGYLPQDPRFEGLSQQRTAMSHVLSGRGLDRAAARLEELRAAMEDSADTASVARFSAAEERYRLDGGYAAAAEVRRLADGLGLGADRLDAPVSTLSGGQRRRVEIARILFAGSDLLLLDEPTNHLDTDAKAWLLEFLRRYKGALVVVSHDLDLLDEAITSVLHLDRPGEEDVATLVAYTGTYSAYLAQRAKDEARAAKVAERQAGEIRRLSTLADRLRHSTATMARKAQTLDSRVARLERDKVDAPVATRSVQLRLPDPPRAGRTVLQVEGLSQRFGSLEVFDDVSFDVGRGERMLVMGLNGAGKTSLLRVLAGVTPPAGGNAEWGHQVVAGYYAQEHEGISAGRSVLDHLREQAPGASDPVLRAVVGGLGLSGDKVHQDAGTLSGGEKTKLALAILVAGRHNVLLLDEPTNNLDPPSREAVATALGGWGGTIVLVSHDSEFVRAIAPGRVLMLPEGKVDHFDDGYLDLVELA